MYKSFLISGRSNWHLQLEGLLTLGVGAATNLSTMGATALFSGGMVFPGLLVSFAFTNWIVAI